nr:DUF2809 domain-containing protein [uncultured Dyadobacter sp.]
MSAVQKKYLTGALAIFVLEVLIALFVRDELIRPWGGDFLVVLLLYCLVRGCTHWNVIVAALVVLLFAWMVEILQYVQIISVMGLEGNNFARTIIGTSFSWGDILAYTLGVGFVLGMERMTGNFRRI